MFLNLLQSGCFRFKEISNPYKWVLFYFIFILQRFPVKEWYLSLVAISTIITIKRLIIFFLIYRSSDLQVPRAGHSGVHGGVPRRGAGGAGAAAVRGVSARADGRRSVSVPSVR